MTKKFFIIGLTALLGVSLFLTGCPTDSDDGGLSEAEKAANELADTSALRGNVTVSGTTVTLTESVNLADGETLEIPAGVTLAVPDEAPLTVAGDLTVADGGTLEVAADGALTVAENGALDVKGAIEVEGEFTVEGDINIPDTGEIEVKDGGTYTLAGGEDNALRLAGENNGTVYIRAGATTVGHGGVLTGTGLNVVEAGAWARVITATVIGTENDATAIFQLKTGTMSFNNWDYILDGTGVLAGTFALYSHRRQTLTVNAGSTLTINSGILLVGNTALDFGGVGTNPGDITIVIEGTVTLVGTVNTNFYPSNSNDAAGAGTVPVGTYKWATDAGGGANAGWKKQ